MTPSASLPPAASASDAPSPSATPKEKLRDCGLEQVRIRSPSPDRPVSVSAPRAESSAEAEQLGEAARDQRGGGAGAEPAAGDDAGGDRQHVLGRAADLDAAHVGRMIGTEASREPSARASAAAMVASRAASVTAVGSPRATSVGEARAGQDRRHAPRRRSAAITSVMNARVPRSMPLAQAMTGVPGRHAPARSTRAATRRCCDGTTSRMAS